MMEFILLLLLCVLWSIYTQLFLDKFLPILEKWYYMRNRAKYFDFTKTRACCIMPTPRPDIYEKEKVRQWVKKLNSVNPCAPDEAKQRYNWFGYGEEGNDEKKS
jgi:hypothetical protein